MKIYTKTGDTGETGLFGGARVAKDHARIEAYGTLDELNAVLGLALVGAGRADEAFCAALERVQSELFQVGAELATPQGKSVGIELIGESQVVALEAEIDRMETRLAPLKTFILPGGSELSARIHVARTVCRRAERALVSLHHVESVRSEVLRYVNRLADYLFVAARYANLQAKVSDVPWVATRGA